MAPKAKAAAGKEAKDVKEKATKGASAKETKAEKPGKKSAKAVEEEVPVAPAENAVDPEELEEAEDAAASGGSNSNEAALAAASSSSEMSASFKNFRHHPDMENFYRFIYENDLRHEALAIIDDIMIEKAKKRAAAGKSAKGGH